MKKIDICVGTDRERNLAVRLSLMIVEDEVVMAERYHRVDIAPGVSLSDARATIEAHLAQPFSVNGIPGSPWPAIPDAEWAEVEAIAGVIHTPERIAKRVSDDEQRLLKATELLNAAQAVRIK